jgi:hypothetical protein
VAEKLSPEENRAAALVILALPGMRFLHEGQLTGAKIKIPVQLSRRPDETPSDEVERAYEKLLSAIKGTFVGRGKPTVLAPRAAWSDNPTGMNFIVVLWKSSGPDFDLVVVNLAPHQSQCYVTLDVAGLAKHDWTMRDTLGNESHRRKGSELDLDGLYLDLPAHGTQLFRFTPAGGGPGKAG